MGGGRRSFLTVIYQNNGLLERLNMYTLQRIYWLYRKCSNHRLEKLDDSLPWPTDQNCHQNEGWIHINVPSDVTPWTRHNIALVSFQSFMHNLNLIMSDTSCKSPNQEQCWKKVGEREFFKMLIWKRKSVKMFQIKNTNSSKLNQKLIVDDSIQEDKQFC